MTVFLIIIAICAAVINFSSRRISEKLPFSELSVKLFALVVVLVCISLIMIIGK